MFSGKTNLPGQPLLEFLPEGVKLSIRVTHRDLYRAGLSETEIAQLTKDDLAVISKRLVDHYLQDAYWEELEYTATCVLEDKNSDNP